MSKNTWKAVVCLVLFFSVCFIPYATEASAASLDWQQMPTKVQATSVKLATVGNLSAFRSNVNQPILAQSCSAAGLRSLATELEKTWNPILQFVGILVGIGAGVSQIWSATHSVGGCPG